MGDTDLCPEIEERLRELSQLGWLCLSKAIELGARVVIVTNATEGWVQAPAHGEITNRCSKSTQRSKDWITQMTCVFAISM
eukprot:4873231-Amphidinium_carterae.1